MICEYNLQWDLCCLDYSTMEWLCPHGPQGIGAGKDTYLSISSNIPVILLKEYNVYDYDLRI